jgi:hypothetical protein
VSRNGGDHQQARHVAEATARSETVVFGPVATAATAAAVIIVVRRDI